MMIGFVQQKVNMEEIEKAILAKKAGKLEIGDSTAEGAEKEEKQNCISSERPIIVRR